MINVRKEHNWKFQHEDLSLIHQKAYEQDPVSIVPQISSDSPQRVDSLQIKSFHSTLKTISNYIKINEYKAKKYTVNIYIIPNIYQYG